MTFVILHPILFNNAYISSIICIKKFVWMPKYYKQNNKTKFSFMEKIKNDLLWVELITLWNILGFWGKKNFPWKENRSISYGNKATV